jgi:hypothetical protein
MQSILLSTCLSIKPAASREGKAVHISPEVDRMIRNSLQEKASLHDQTAHNNNLDGPTSGDAQGVTEVSTPQ